MKKDIKDLIDNLTFIKEKSSRLLNDFHKTSYSEEYWWVLSGIYGVQIWRIIQLFRNNREGILSLLAEGDIKGMAYFEYKNRIYQYLGSCVYKKNEFKFNAETPVSDVANEAEFFDNNFLGDFGLIDWCSDIKSAGVDEVYKYLTQGLSRLYNNFISQGLAKKFLWEKNAENFSVYYNLAKDCATASDREVFGIIFIHLMPSYLTHSYPKRIARLLMRLPLKKITTYNGYELNIFKKIIIAQNYYKKGNGGWFNIISHGLLTCISTDLIYHNSLTNRPLIGFNSCLLLPKKVENVKKYDFLLVPSEAPNPLSFASPAEYNKFLSYYSRLLAVMLEVKMAGCSVRIRFKDFSYVKYIPSDDIEYALDREQRRFEDCYHEYGVIVCPAADSTIAGKCMYNNIDFFAFYNPYYVVERSVYDEIKRQKGAFTEFDDFVTAIKSYADNALAYS